MIRFVTTLALALAACSGNPTAREICADMATAVCAVETECRKYDAATSADCLVVFEERCCEANGCLDRDWETDSSNVGVAECLDAIEAASCKLLGGELPEECRPPR